MRVSSRRRRRRCRQMICKGIESFLAVQNSSIGPLVCLSVCLFDRTNNQSLHKPKEWSHTLVTFGTFDQSDKETWPDQKRSTYLHTYLPTFLSTSIREHPKGAIIGTCDIWDTDYNTDNWEPGFMTIFVTWQLIVTLGSIRNSCDVFSIFSDCISGYSRVTIGPLIFAINLKCWSIRNILWGHMKVVCPGSKDQTLIFGTFGRIGIFDFEHETWNAQPETVFISFHCIVC